MKAKWAENHQDFLVGSFPPELVEEVRKYVKEAVEQELGVVVETGEEYCDMVKKLQLRVEKLGQVLAIRIVEERIAERVEWRTEEMDSKERRKGLKFYVKARAGEFSRATSHHVDFVKEYLVEEGVSHRFMISYSIDYGISST